jgi:hypothetical protein
MKILDVCDQCGTIFATIEMNGPPYVIDEWLSRTRSDLGMCSKCGGHVRRVKEGEANAGRTKRKDASSKESWLSRLFKS